MNIVEKVIEKAGGVMVLSKLLNVNHQLVMYWQRRGYFPVTWVKTVRAHFPDIDAEEFINSFPD